jgi:D-psicose/D-tagatose/L-ribulose 3-epimerase
MKFGLNMLLWTSDVTEEHYPLLEQIKSWGYDGVELPVFELEKSKFTKLGKKLDSIGLGRDRLQRCREPHFAQSEYPEGGIVSLEEGD